MSLSDWTAVYTLTVCLFSDVRSFPLPTVGLLTLRVKGAQRGVKTLKTAPERAVPTAGLKDVRKTP